MSEQMKILIAYDGSDCANAALEDLHGRVAACGRGADHVRGRCVSATVVEPGADLPAEVPVAVQRAWA